MKAILCVALLVAVATASTVKFTTCPGTWVYNIDIKNVYTKPADIEKGDTASLFVDGIMGEAVKLNDLELDVYWDGTFLHKVDNPETAAVNKNQEYKLPFSVNIPTFAPSGTYTLTAYVWGTPTGGAKAKLGCVKAEFTL